MWELRAKHPDYSEFCLVVYAHADDDLTLARRVEPGKLMLLEHEIIVHEDDVDIEEPTFQPRCCKPRVDCSCNDCGKCTFHTDMYMVLQDVWSRAIPKHKGLLCIACLEARIGRELVRADFIKCPLNTLLMQNWCEGTLLEQRLKPTLDYRGLTHRDW